MKNKVLVLTVLVLALTVSTWAKVDTRLFLVSHTYNIPEVGRATLIVDVQAKSTVADQKIGHFQDAFVIGGVLFNQTDTLMYSERLFEMPDYQRYETLVAWPKNKARYTYTLKSGGTPKTVGLDWTKVVRVTIIYRMIDDYSNLSRTGYPPYEVRDDLGNDIKGRQLPICCELCDLSLPVDISNFEATYSVDQGNIIAWRTESELNCAGFHVWRGSSVDGEFTRVTTNLIMGRGTATDPHDYQFTDRDVRQNAQYWYQVEEISLDGVSTFFEPFPVQKNTAVRKLPTDAMPHDWELLQNYPNPFNPMTEIRYTIPVQADVTVKIINLLGNEITTLVRQQQAPGSYSIVWDGTNAYGQPVESGVYFYTLQTGNHVLFRKMTLLK